MTWKPQRRQRIQGLTPEQAVLQLADDLDVLDGVVEEHIDDDDVAFKALTEGFNAWQLEFLQSRNRTLLLVALALLAALAGVITPLATR